MRVYSDEEKQRHTPIALRRVLGRLLFKWEVRAGPLKTRESRLSRTSCGCNESTERPDPAEVTGDPTARRMAIKRDWYQHDAHTATAPRAAPHL
jgi:hypothetical protein